tara:strand:+ start:6189 stop:6470 length:282 start_codon:yes stop_codon:yes gene_type:complete
MDPKKTNVMNLLANTMPSSTYNDDLRKLASFSRKNVTKSPRVGRLQKITLLTNVKSTGIGIKPWQKNMAGRIGAAANQELRRKIRHIIQENRL